MSFWYTIAAIVKARITTNLTPRLHRSVFSTRERAFHFPCRRLLIAIGSPPCCLPPTACRWPTCSSPPTAAISPFRSLLGHTAFVARCLTGFRLTATQNRVQKTVLQQHRTGCRRLSTSHTEQGAEDRRQATQNRVQKTVDKPHRTGCRRLSTSHTEQGAEDRRQATQNRVQKTVDKPHRTGCRRPSTIYTEQGAEDRRQATQNRVQKTVFNLVHNI